MDNENENNTSGKDTAAKDVGTTRRSQIHPSQVGSVESGYEPPAPPQRGRGRSPYPWERMKPGQSFTVPADRRKSAYASGMSWCRRNAPDLRIVWDRDGKDPSRARIWLRKREGKPVGNPAGAQPAD